MTLLSLDLVKNWAGAAQGYERIIGVTLGTGFGGGFIANGRIFYSGQGVPPDGGVWNLPYLEGIAEDYVSGPSLGKKLCPKNRENIYASRDCPSSHTG